MADYVIIVAGGKGERMGSRLPKQFLPLCGRPILMHTIERFAECGLDLRIILALPHSQQGYWKKLCAHFGFDYEVSVVDGGETRFHSVKNALDVIPDDEEGVVAVHDGVRPFVGGFTIRNAVREARLSGAAVPVVPVVDTLRELYKVDAPEALYELSPKAAATLAGRVRSHTVFRDNYRIVQTPQVFGISTLKRAYAQAYRKEFTDDASVVEYSGVEVNLVEGNPENIKITTPVDIVIGEVLIKTFVLPEKEPSAGIDDYPEYTEE